MMMMMMMKTVLLLKESGKLLSLFSFFLDIM